MAKIQYKNATYRTHGDLPVVGSCAPDVSLVNIELQNVSFANWMGLRKVLSVLPSHFFSSSAGISLKMRWPPALSATQTGPSVNRIPPASFTTS